MKQRELLRKKAQLAATLPDPSEKGAAKATRFIAARGSLFRRLIRHRKGCPKCERGEGHPVWVLSISYRGGKNKQISLSAEQRRQVELWTENYRRLKAGLEAISEINHRLLRSDE